MHKARLGSISHGTLRTQDLLEAFGEELKFLSDEPADKALVIEAMRLLDVEEFDDNEEASNLVYALLDALDAHAPPFCYFGNTEGDGADFGFWPSMESIEELPRISDSATDDEGESIDFAAQARALGEECVFVNDHGNVTVYGADGSILLELV